MANKNEMKFDANDILESMYQELTDDEIREFLKAVIAFSIGLPKIDDVGSRKLETVLNYTFENENIQSFIQKEIYEYAQDLFEEELTSL